MTQFNKTLKTVIVFFCLVTFNGDAVANTTPIPGVGVVVKRNPGGGASKITTASDGKFSIQLKAGSYTISLPQDELSNAVNDILKNQYPQSSYKYDGEGIALNIDETKGITIERGAADGYEQIAVITVTAKKAVLTGSLNWDDKVMNSPQAKPAGYVGHVTLIKRNAGIQGLAGNNGCPAGYEWKDGWCQKIILAGNQQTMVNTTKSNSIDNKATVNEPNDQNVVNTTKSNTKDLVVNPQSIECPKGFYEKNGECIPIPAASAKSGDYVGHVTLIKRNAMMIAIGGGSVTPNSAGKTNAYLTNMAGLNIDVYKPLVVKNSFTFGINAGMEYSFSNKEQLTAMPTAYNTKGQIAAPTVVQRGSGSPKNAGFKFGIGPQIDFIIGDKFSISPILQAAYINLTQKAFSAEQTTEMQGRTNTYTLLSQSETKTNGIGIIPKLRLQYMFGRIGIWAEGSYTVGPAIKNTVSTWMPAGNPTVDGEYTISQMENGSTTKWERSTKYSSTGFTGGIVIRLSSAKQTCGCCGKWVWSTHDTKSCCDFKKGMESMKKLTEPWDTLVPNGPWIVNMIIGACQLHPDCEEGGIICRPKGGSLDIENLSLAKDQIFTRSSIKLKGNNILITSVGFENRISKGTLAKFINRKVDVKPTGLPEDAVEKLFKSINLNVPEKPVTFSTDEITYTVNKTTRNGNPVNLIKIKEATRINIDGKEYNLTVVTISERHDVMEKVVHEYCACCGGLFKVSDLSSHEATCCKKDPKSRLFMQEDLKDIATKTGQAIGGMRLCPCCQDYFNEVDHCEICKKPFGGGSKPQIAVKNINLKLAGKRFITILNSTEGETGWSLLETPAVETMQGIQLLTFKAVNSKREVKLMYPVVQDPGSTAIYVSPNNYDGCWKAVNCDECLYDATYKTCSCTATASGQPGGCTKKHPRLGDHGFPYLLNPAVWADGSDKLHDWLDAKTLSIKYFEYKSNFVIDEPLLCNDLGVQQLSIKQGHYAVSNRNNNTGGTIELPLVIPIKLPAGRLPIAGRVYEGTNPKGENCNGYGNACFFATGPVDKANLQLFTVTPIIENGLCTKIEVHYRGNGSPKAAGF